ncbi:MAG: SCP2 sterol-binding domain-containing protein [Burkholderiaceae bacterium]|nr:SCP2 sterol-binding domain-containing protein [Burkholderiaceae bacterium]
MLPLPAFLAPAAVYATALNTLLRREDWARHRLTPHSGKTVRFVVGGLVVGLSIQSDGLVQVADAAIVPDVTLTMPVSKLGKLPGVLQAREPALIAALLHIEGDAGLASVVSDLAKDLRWDMAHDLAQVVGDIPATRLIGVGKSMLDAARTATRRLGGNVAEYLGEESGMMASQPAFQVWQHSVQSLQQRLDALEARVTALSSAKSAVSNLSQAS